MSPAPVTPVTDIGEDLPSVATKTNKSSLADAVVKAAVLMVLAELERSLDLITSVARAAMTGGTAMRRSAQASSRLTQIPTSLRLEIG